MPPPEGAADHDVADDLSIEEAADRLGIPAALLRRRVEAGLVPAYRVDGETGPTWRLRRSDLDLEVHGRGATSSTAHQPMAARVELRADRPGEELAALLMAPVEPRRLVEAVVEQWRASAEEWIEAEVRWRLEREVAGRDAEISRLRLELEASEARHAAALALRDRVIADQERELGRRAEELEEVRRFLRERERDLDAARRELDEARSRGRRWPWSRHSGRAGSRGLPRGGDKG